MADKAGDTNTDSIINLSDPLRTRPGVGRQLGCTPGAVQALIDRGLLYPAYKIGGRVMIPESAVRTYLERSRIDPHRSAATA